MALAPTTELEAINAMLSIIGESPVNAIDDTGVVDAVIARQILSEVSREVQARGWHWNTDRAYALSLSFPEKEIYLPENVLSVELAPGQRDLDVVQRGRRLYDRRKHSYVFDRAVKADLVRLLGFEELPEPARQYIMVRAGRIFQDRIIGSQALNGFNVADENRAWATLRNHEAKTAQYNVLRDNWSVARVLHRWS